MSRQVRLAVVVLVAFVVLGGGYVAVQLAGRSGATGSGRTPRIAAAPSGSPSSSPSGSPSASPSPQTPADVAAAVRAENARPGTPGWRIGSTAGRAPGLGAYADRVSVRAGESVGLYVDGTPGTVPVRAMRIGDYGGVGARLVWTGSVLASAQPSPQGRVENGPIADAGGLHGTDLVVAPWHLSGTVDTTGWPEGDYLLRLDAAAASRYVPITVRSAVTRGRVVLVAGAMTWQAYNKWGGASLYDDDEDEHEGRHGGEGGRGGAVSFDRPYVDGFGSGRFLTYDGPLVATAERAGLPLAWVTDYDVATDPALLDGAAAIVLGGHAEYWTAPMRDAVTKAVDGGTNLAVLGANTAYWRVRLAGRATGVPGQPDRRDGRPRIVTGTKNAAADPLRFTDPGGTTARFRDAPQARPEEQLTGMRYDCFPAEASWTVTDPTWWGYAGAGVHAGEKLEGVVGPEADRVYPAATRPVPEEVVAYQRYTCGGRGGTAHTGVYWTAPSGAAVFAVGTMRWVCALETHCTHVPGVRSSQVVNRVTTNVLTAFAEPRAGLVHPARDTVSTYWLPARSTTGAS
jgi:hypothetical protein